MEDTMDASKIAPSILGRVGVLMGGTSAEREVSLESGKYVLEALLKKGVDAHKVDVGDDIAQVLIKEKFDRVFNVLHGPVGEDGTIQGLLELLKIPYTGSGVCASAMGMDKHRCKHLFRDMKIPVLDWDIAHTLEEAKASVKRLGFPLVFKPVFQGSSIGITKVENASQVDKAFEKARSFSEVMIEPWVTGHEFTVGIINDIPLPSIEIKTPQGFYDYDFKYISNDTQYLCPSPLKDLPGKEAEIQAIALRAFKALGARHWARVDIMMDQNNQFWVLELNTQPGMTSHSLVPMAVRATGSTFEDAVFDILCQTLNDGSRFCEMAIVVGSENQKAKGC